VRSTKVRPTDSLPPSVSRLYARTATCNQQEQPHYEDDVQPQFAASRTRLLGTGTAENDPNGAHSDGPRLRSPAVAPERAQNHAAVMGALGQSATAT
jgi:hypothetical protein